MQQFSAYTRTILARDEGTSLLEDLLVLALVAVAVAAFLSRTPIQPPELCKVVPVSQASS